MIDVDVAWAGSIQYSSEYFIISSEKENHFQYIYTDVCIRAPWSVRAQNI